MERTQRLFKRLPLAQRAVRTWRYYRNELMVLGFVKDPSRMTTAETMSRTHLESQISDATLAREALTRVPPRLQASFDQQ